MQQRLFVRDCSPSAVNLFSSQPIKSYAFCFPTVLIKSKQKSPNKKIKKLAVFYRRKNYGNPNFNYSNTRSRWKPAVQQEKKRHVIRVVSSVLKRSSFANNLRVVKTGLAMEKVTILRRGESLDSKIKSESRKEAFCFFPLSSLFFCQGFFICF